MLYMLVSTVTAHNFHIINHLLGFNHTGSTGRLNTSSELLTIKYGRQLKKTYVEVVPLHC